MQDLVILGAGTAGTMAANRLRRRLGAGDWRITVVDHDDQHLYQPGLLLLPFGVYRPAELVRPRHRFLRAGVDLVSGEVDRVDADTARVLLRDGRSLGYDQLVIATGSTSRPDQTPGMTEGEWRRSIFDFYTLPGAVALRDRLGTWKGGRLVVHVVEMPVKCPVAPLEFAFLADAFFAERGMRDRVELTYVTPLDGAFTQPVAARHLGSMLDERKIALESDFVVDRVEPGTRTLVSMDEREVPFDLLVTVPLHMGADYVGRSGLGDELNYVPVDKHTLQARAHENVFALGDANDLPTSKAGSVAHFSTELFADNFVDHVHGRPMLRSFDGHANCFIESGRGKGLLIDFNYDTEPLPGRFPLPGVGPFTLLEESRVNHWGKLGFRWAYWHLLLPGRPLPVPALMSMAGKHPSAEGDGHARDRGRRSPRPRRRRGLPHRLRRVGRAGGHELAARIGIELTDAHWKVLRFLREDFRQQGETATTRRVQAVGGVPVKEQFALFPKKPAKKMAYVAGLPKPRGCV